MARALRGPCARAILEKLETWRYRTGVAPITVSKLLQRSTARNVDRRQLNSIFEPCFFESHAEGHHAIAKVDDQHRLLDFRNPHGGSFLKQWRAHRATPHTRTFDHRSRTSGCEERMHTRQTEQQVCAALAAAYASAHGKGYSSSSGKGRLPDFKFETLFTKLAAMDPAMRGESKLKKVTVVGVGNVGMACAQTILTDNLTDAIALVDVDPKKLRGEMLDLQHAAAFMPTVSILADVDYKITSNSDVCIITAGARQREGEDRLSLVDRNVQVFKQIIPQLVKYSPNTIFLVISNPVDILAWVTWKLSGFPPNRVLGSGTNLDTSRFRHLLANHFKVSAHNVHANILGEHGDSSVPVWSSVQVAGVPVTPFLLNKGESTDTEVLKLAHKAVVEGAYEVIELKGYTSWAIGYSAAGLVSSILRNQRRVHPVSVLSQGFHGIQQEVYLSLPAMLGGMGVHAVVNSEFSKEEIRQLHESAAQLWEIQRKVKL